MYQQKEMPSRKRRVRKRTQRSVRRTRRRSVGRRTHLQRMINIDMQNSLPLISQQRSPKRPTKQQRSSQRSPVQGKHLDFSRSLTLDDLTSRLHDLSL